MGEKENRKKPNSQVEKQSTLSRTTNPTHLWWMCNI